MAGAALVVIVPLLVWQDYLWSIYRTTSMVGGDQLALPFNAYFETWIFSVSGVRHAGVTSPAIQALAVVVALTVQAVFIIWIRAYQSPWWRIAAAFAVLMMIVDPVVWLGYPGAITRVVLPLTFGFNILLARVERGFWGWYVLGNLHVVAALHAMPIPGMPPPI
jgi:hypothetical protein